MNGPGAADRRTAGLDTEFTYLEFNYPTTGHNGVDIANTRSSPRLMKTHLHAKFFTRPLEGAAVSPRIIVVTRNPKDVLVSYYHFSRDVTKLFAGGEWDDFFAIAQNKKMMSGDYFDHVLT